MLIFSLGLVATFFSMPIVIQKMRTKKIGGADIHKRGRPFIPEMGGIAVILGLCVSVFSSLLLFRENSIELTSFLASVLISGLIGAIDDVKTINARVKPLLTLFSGVPIILAGTYNKYGPILPLIGQTRMTVIYPFLIPIALAVTSNATNMMDPFNGTMSGTSLITIFFLLISAVLLGHSSTVLICVCILGPILALHYFNRFPAKVFSGDIGSLAIGASLGAVAIIGQIEVIAIIAFAPQIMNAFYGLSSVGKLYERREVSRPTRVLNDGRLTATDDPKAPITLARTILARGPLYEYEAVRVFMILSIISGVFSIITAYLTLVKF